MIHIFCHIPKCAGGTVQTHIESQIPAQARFGPHHPDYQKMVVASLSKKQQREWEKDPSFVKRSWVAAYLRSLSPAQKDALQCVYGHAAYYGAHQDLNLPARYITFLREPLARFVSYYNYISTVRVTPERLKLNEIQREDGSRRSVDEWLLEANLTRCSMSAFLWHLLRDENLLKDYTLPRQEDFAAIKDMLASFYFVGLTENKEDMDFVFRSLHLTRSLPDKNVLRTKDTYMNPRDMAQAAQIVRERCPMDVELYEFGAQLNREQKAGFAEA